MYVVMNVLAVPQEAKTGMADMFGHGAEHMKRVPGFLEYEPRFPV